MHFLYGFFCCVYLSEEAAFQVIVPVLLMNQDFKTTHFTLYYRSGTVNSKSFVGKVLLRTKWKFELTYAL